MFQFENIQISINETKNKDRLQYICQNNEDKNTRYIEGPLPLALSARNELVQYLISNTNLKRFNKEAKEEELEKIYKKLYIEYEKSIKEKEENLRKEEENIANEKQEKLRQGKKLYENIDTPLQYIKELCDWISAGETKNILFALNAYISQICLKSGINVIIEGDAANGKDHIRRTAFGFLPEDSVVMEKNVTQAVIFRRSEEDVCFYDRKIVYYGDMGGTTDKENMEGSINLMKELQTEHYLNKPTNISEEGGWNVVDLTLEGTPSVTFTTIPNAVLDPQILSRGVILMPRNDNKREFFTFKAIMDFKGKEWEYVETIIKPAINNVKNMITYLNFITEDLIIINPYYESLQSLLSESMFYKRDYDKYRNLLYSITLLNSVNNIIEYDGKKYLAVTGNDLRLYSELINPYIDIASSNITKGAMKVLEEFNRLDSTLQGSNKLPDVDGIFELTKDEFRKRSKLNYAKSSINKYFSELLQAGYLEVSDEKSGKKNKYILTEKGAKKNSKVELYSKPKWSNINLPMGLKQELLNKDILNTNIKLFCDEYSMFERPPWKDRNIVMEYTGIIKEDK